MSFPTLPATAQPWRPSVVIASGQLYNIFMTTKSLIETGNYNTHRIKAHEVMMRLQIPPLVNALLKEPGLEEWISTISSIFLGFYQELERLPQEASHSTNNTSIPVEPYVLVYTGRPGRPAKKIRRDALEWASKSSIKFGEIASLFGVSPSHLYVQMKEAGLPTSRFSKIEDDDLDKVVQAAMAARPDTGVAYLTGYLRANYQLRIQRSRLRQAVRDADVVAAAIRQQVSAKKPRGNYRVSRPHALWHIDGHHKLIKWGVVIHGVIDGYSRKITGLRASTRNTAETVLDMFIDSVLEHGVPSRVRGDRGGENRDVSIAMIRLRGRHRGSFLWGPSVHNTPIERLWVELGRRFCRAWRVFFLRLARLHNLDRGDPTHLWLLHFLFLEMINEDCRRFVAEWNAHPMRNRQYKSPNDIEMEGMIKCGVYDNVLQGFVYPDECEGMSVEEIGAYYASNENTAGSGDEAESDKEAESEDDMLTDNEASPAPSSNDFDEQPEGDDDRRSDEGWSDHEEDYELDEQELEDVLRTIDEKTGGIGKEHEVNIDEDVDPNIHHNPVPVPMPNCPLPREHLALFRNCVDTVHQQNHLPCGYGVRPEEWDDGAYPEIEELPIGRSQRSKVIQLPSHIWYPRAVLWSQALALLQSSDEYS
ncbi:hypothetical protein CVT24_008269 [Panaeolus cyanescens]|uniref:Integrase catalytic domain-containing protein n=1 Tax=Panaeolus cyanescens TaxID=181874 RepID=A0A409W0G3_9AGAR|nr:hypothetical protein CVT24_008269 [Panaeolus cyanescens]